MDTDTLTPPVESPETPVETTPEPVEDSASISDHAEQFAPEDKRAPIMPDVAEARREAAATQKRDDVGRFDEGRVRHRAQSQKAGVEDVKAINELTRELRTKEAELAKHRPESVAETPRIKALRRQIRAIESELGEVQPKPVQRAEPAPQPRPYSPPSNGQDKKPLFSDFDNDPDPLEAWTVAVGRWAARQEHAEMTQRQTQQAQAEAVQRQELEQLENYQRHISGYAASKPDFLEKTQPFMQKNLPYALLRAIVESGDKAGDIVYTLAQRPDLTEDLIVKTYGRDARDTDFVASVQRLLTQHAAAVKTGSAPVQRPYTPPKPPNPVRTGSVQTSDEPPGEGASIADHARYYSPQKRW